MICSWWFPYFVLLPGMESRILASQSPLSVVMMRMIKMLQRRWPALWREWHRTTTQALLPMRKAHVVPPWLCPTTAWPIRYHSYMKAAEEVVILPFSAFKKVSNFRFYFLLCRIVAICKALLPFELKMLLFWLWCYVFISMNQIGSIIELLLMTFLLFLDHESWSSFLASQKHGAREGPHPSTASLWLQASRQSSPHVEE